MDENGKWKCSPAYDLTFSQSSHGWHSTAVAGESKMPKRKDLLKLAGIFQLKNANEIINHIEAVVLDWKKYANEAEVRKQNANYIGKFLKI
jgi:serine/threonine-protein kinase HipA